MRRGLALLALCLLADAAQAAREPVLKQVDLPHSYYWRELYLPQLTAGPSAATWLPDGETLVYSMGGSLWRQRIGDDTAVELTHAARAYDYQPDAARDGRSVVFARYDGNAIELWRLDLVSGREQRLTSGGAVNVEPRLSPDGTRLAWVSTQGSGHFNLFVAGIDARGLHGAHMLLGERKSALDRYYYSAYDHAINPAWSPDGTTLYYVGNPEIGWGTGDLWAVPVDDPARRRRVLSEETNWSARPEPAPDGKRLLYASYHGRQHQQLWLTTPGGAAPLPLTFGDFDRRNARWSPDGARIAYVDNRDGNTALRVMDVPGGATHDVVAKHRATRLPQAHLVLDIVDEHGARTPARVAVLAGDGRAYAPDDAWMHADDGFDRKLQAAETHYFHCTPPCALELPAGKAAIRVQRGFAYAPWRETVRLDAGRATTLRAELRPQRLPAAFGGFVSADLHIHMNYGGHYRNTPAHLALQARAEDLDIAWDLVVNKEERVPDIAAFRTGADPASTAQTLVLHGQEYHTSFWGHLGLLNLADHFLTPDFAAYRHTAMASPYPTNAAVADLAHAQGALVGYVHPFDVLPDPARDAVLSNELPADVIAGKVDYIEVMGFSDHKATAQVWYRLLNLGFRLPTGAGTDAMANYASLRGPVGLNRVFLDTGGRRDAAAATAALKAGHGFASNGPLLGLLIDGARPGDTLAAPGRHRYRVALRSPVAVEHLELVQNGKVVKAFALRGDRRSLDAEGVIDLAGGWVLLRAWNDGADPEVFDLYPYATTNPVWIGDRVRAPDAREDAAWFAAWLTRTLEAAAARDDYDTADERRITLDYLRRARDAYRALADGGADAASTAEAR
ncbi:periplasmic component of the Tol biopolymertransport system [Mizugakiibacter sediminis]|uniref:Periplasmic component of the Tol biopolymertransport system n=1 Tax=Mizugakiibacter sediminis TaxID=1475481 RepID=A0A0K8QRD1_9GAMM|nr:CehA/McbA family metallohydrolase [Mizugakiibacter sediminis]GAP67499.1 periplasmic component of the Tol biopolymertransport system [Mizugakiibacter sediminis]